ncbi:GNAT family N-acetyltransferase [Actinoalloteichus caeruleus]|uniref:GNAT family N-acetyltransferase n=1 Tax=Actinoalloteichus cyanogriseus TaxID=2893586 RepID=UPI000A5262EE|nr:GNAT family N-acetyltransferase [Actinoalloteichus caeruleus]
MISSERLDLVPLDAEALSLVVVGDVPGLERALGVVVPPEWPATVPARLRLDQLAEDPAELPWLVRAMVDRDERRIVGVTGFHGRPDDRGRAEVGYEVLPGARRRGYAREAVLALADWANASGAALTCVASVAPTNEASLSLVRSLGFRQVGERLDPVDGVELVFERGLPFSLDP